MYHHNHYDIAVVLNLVLIKPQGFGESASRVWCYTSPHLYDLGHPNLLGHFVPKYRLKLCTFLFEEKNRFTFSNYEGFNECMCGACEVLYLQQG